jgi:hypothetical protein
MRFHPPVRLWRSSLPSLTARASVVCRVAYLLIVIEVPSLSPSGSVFAEASYSSVAWVTLETVKSAFPCFPGNCPELMVHVPDGLVVQDMGPTNSPPWWKSPATSALLTGLPDESRIVTSTSACQAP